MNYIPYTLFNLFAVTFEDYSNFCYFNWGSAFMAQEGWEWGVEKALQEGTS